MKNLFYLLIVTFGLISCVDLGFEKQQPQNGEVISKLPEEYIGSYVNKEDTLIVLEKMVISGTDTTFLMLDSFMELRSWNDFIFLNSHKLEGEYWTSIVVRRVKDQLVIYTPDVQEEDLDKLSKKFEVRVHTNNQDKVEAYIINPSSADWKKLLKGPFYSKSVFTKIN